MGGDFLKKMAAAIAIFMTALLLITACNSNNSTPETSEELTTKEITTAETTEQVTTAPITTIQTAVNSSSVATGVSTVTANPQQPRTSAPINNCTSRYGYYQLSADEKIIYDQIVDAAKTFQTEVILKQKLPSENVKKVCNLVYLEENNLYYINEYSQYYNGTTGLVSKVGLSYRYTSMTVDIINKEVEAKAKQILAKITPQMSVVDKIKLFHDEIILNCSYNTTSEYKTTPYGALVSGEALCEGYSRAFALLCNKVGIENLFATSAPVGNEQHMWNMVKLNGYWYNIDLTSDDPISADERIGPDYICYNYFLFKNTEFGRPNVLDNSLFTLPQATASQFNYFNYYGLYAASYNQFETLLGTEILKALQSKDKYVNIKLASKDLYQEAADNLTNEKLSTLFDYFDSQTGHEGSYYYSLSPELNIIQVQITYE